MSMATRNIGCCLICQTIGPSSSKLPTLGGSVSPVLQTGVFPSPTWWCWRLNLGNCSTTELWLFPSLTPVPDSDLNDYYIVSAHRSRSHHGLAHPPCQDRPWSLQQACNIMQESLPKFAHPPFHHPSLFLTFYTMPSGL